MISLSEHLPRGQLLGGTRAGGYGRGKPVLEISEPSQTERQCQAVGAIFRMLESPLHLWSSAWPVLVPGEAWADRLALHVGLPGQERSLGDGCFCLK